MKLCKSMEATEYVNAASHISTLQCSSVINVKVLLSLPQSEAHLILYLPGGTLSHRLQPLFKTTVFLRPLVTLHILITTESYLLS